MSEAEKLLGEVRTLLEELPNDGQFFRIGVNKSEVVIEKLLRAANLLLEERANERAKRECRHFKCAILVHHRDIRTQGQMVDDGVPGLPTPVGQADQSRGPGGHG